MFTTQSPRLEYLTESLSKERKRVLTDPDTFGAVLLGVLCDIFGEDLLTWNPLTVKMDVEDFLADQWRMPIYNKAMAAITIVSTDYLLQGVPQFVSIAKALNGEGIDADYADDIDLDDLLWTVMEADRIWPIDSRDEETHKIILPAQIEKLISMKQEIEGFSAIPKLANITFQLKPSTKATDQLGVDETAMSLQVDKMEGLKNELENRLQLFNQQIKDIPLSKNYNDVPKSSLEFYHF